MTELPSAEDETGAIGDRVKSLRKARELTLVRLAELSGVSRAALSKIERGEISPTYATVRKIGIGLNITVATLVSAETSEAAVDFEVVRSDESNPFDAESNGYKLLAGSAASRSVRCFTSEVRSPYSSNPENRHVHNTEDTVLVLNGAIVCHLEGHAPIQLSKGDSLFYKASIPHTFTRAPEADDTSAGDGSFPTALWISTGLN